MRISVRYPRALATTARPMPVLPAVDSTTNPPGFRSPRFSASRIIHLPARSLTDWPGFINSALPRMVQPVNSDARFSLIRGVLPIVSTTSLLKFMVLKFFAWVVDLAATLVEPAGSYKGTLGYQIGAATRKIQRLLGGFGEYDLTDVDIP